MNIPVILSLICSGLTIVLSLLAIAIVVFHGPTWVEREVEEARREEFIAAYAARSGVSVGWLAQHRHAVPCPCDEKECQGWAMVPLDFETHNGLPLAEREPEGNVTYSEVQW